MNNEYIEKLREIEQNETVNKKETTNDIVASDKHFEIEKVLTDKSIIAEQKQEDLNFIKESEEFKNSSKKITAMQVAEKMRADNLALLSEKQKNDLAEHALLLEKQRLDTLAKQDKKIVKEEAKADIYDKKRQIAEKRYGYLYKADKITIIENDKEIEKLVYKDFTPSKSINRTKEFSNWYKNLSNETQKVINTTCKFILKLGMWGAVGGGIYGLIMWILNSGLAV